MSNYKNKYLKYKNKYKELKNNKLFGGFHEYDNEEIIKNNDIYCLESHSIVPYKNQMIKFLDIVEKKLTDDLAFKENEQKFFIDTPDEKYNKSIKSRNSKRINAIRRKIEEMCIDKDKNYCKDTTTFTMSHGKEYNDLETLYLNKEFKIELKKLFFNMKPITFLSSNFYPIEEPNFIVYIERTINEELYYFEIYKNITHDDVVITYYLLTSAYRLVKQEDRPENLKEKIASYPFIENMLHINNLDNRIHVEGFILAYNLDKLTNIFKMYALMVPDIFSKWISNFLTFKLPSTLIHYESFIVMDAFIISNNYHIYNNIYKNFILPEYDNTITPQNHEQINKFLIDKINKDENILVNIMSIPVLFTIINKISIFTKFIMDNLINAYNCSKINFLANNITKDTSTLFTRNLKNLNKYLNFTKNQIYISIILELYNELYYFLILTHYILRDDLLCILNSIYYHRIYNLSNVKNLINYESQFSITNIQEMYIPSDKKKDEIIIFGIKFYIEKLKKLYNTALSLPHYYSFKDSDAFCKIDVPKPDGTIKYRWTICGENTILNLINLLILDKITGKLDYKLLPECTINSLKDFYKKYDTIEKLKLQLVISEFAKILWNIPFEMIVVDDIVDINHTVYSEYDVKNITSGTEIRPSYQNICRILIHIFGLEDVDGLNIYNYENSKLKSFNINNMTLRIILEQINSSYAKEMVNNYSCNMADITEVNFKNLGIIKMEKLHSNYNLTESPNKILEDSSYYTTISTKILENDLPKNQLVLHCGYCGILSYDYIYNFYVLSSDFLNFFNTTLINKRYELNFYNAHIILNYIFDNNREIYNQIIKENQMYYDLFKYYESYYESYYKILNYDTKILICLFINKVILVNTLEHYIYDINTQSAIMLFYDCLFMVQNKDINIYLSHFNLSKIHTFYNNIHINIFFIIFSKCNSVLSLFDFNEEFVIFLLIETNNPQIYLTDERLKIKFPNLLINMLSNHKFFNLIKSTNILKYIDIINKLINDINYDVDELKLNFSPIINIISQLKIENITKKNKINEKYIEYLRSNVIFDYVSNFIVNYNIILYINLQNPNFHDDNYNDILLKILHSKQILHQTPDIIDIYINLILYLLDIQKKPIEEIVLHLEAIAKLNQSYFLTKSDIINKILEYISYLELLKKTPDIAWHLILIEPSKINIPITDEVVEVLLLYYINREFNSNIPEYSDLLPIFKDKIFYVLNKYLVENNDDYLLTIIILFDNHIIKVMSYMKEYITFINKIFGSDITKYLKVQKNLIKNIKNENNQFYANKNFIIFNEMITEHLILSCKIDISNYDELPTSYKKILFYIWIKYLYEAKKSFNSEKINLFLDVSISELQIEHCIKYYILSYIEKHINKSFTINNDYFMKWKDNLEKIKLLPTINKNVKKNIDKIISVIQKKIDENITLVLSKKWNQDKGIKLRGL